MNADKKVGWGYFQDFSKRNANGTWSRVCYDNGTITIDGANFDDFYLDGNWNVCVDVPKFVAALYDADYAKRFTYRYRMHRIYFDGRDTGVHAEEPRGSFYTGINALGRLLEALEKEKAGA